MSRVGKHGKPLTEEQREAKNKRDRERRAELAKDPAFREAHNSRRRKANMTDEQWERKLSASRASDERKRVETAPEGVTPEMLTANNTYQKAQRYDRKNGTETRNELPAALLELVRVYKRLKMRDYRKRQPLATGQIIPEDGIIDPIAIEVTVKGERLVRLTRTERVLAVALMARQGLSEHEMAPRLGLSNFTVYHLHKQAKRLTRAEVDAALSPETVDVHELASSSAA